MCLLHALIELAPRWNLELRVLHLDHGLRGAESQADAEFVRDAAAKLGLPCELESIRLTPGNVEQEARRARLRFFHRVIREAGADRVALGHTASDQAETVLFRLLRGAGTAGLAGIRPLTAGGIVRPLIEVERTAVLEFLKTRGIEWREDSSNQSRAFARNRIRHDLLPVLTRAWNPALTKTLAQTAAWAQAEEDWWEEEVRRLSAQRLIRRPGAVLARAGDLADLHRAAARRLVRRAIEEVKGDLRSIDFDHVERVLRLARGPRGEGCVRLPAVEVRRSFDRMRFAPPAGPEECPSYRLWLPVPGEVSAPCGAIATEVIEKEGLQKLMESRYNGSVSCLDWNQISGPLELRNWQPGDRYHPAEYTGEEKIKILFQRARVPMWERRGWPVIVRGGEILWARTFGPAARYSAPASGPLLVVHDRPL
jgi:tRNA(Ile)-lysidine synthase